MSLVTQFILIASLSSGAFLIFALAFARSNNPKGFNQLIILIGCFCLIILEQWLKVVNPAIWSLVNRTTIWIPFLFGPCFWLFVKSLNAPQTINWRLITLHYLPALICLLYFIPYYLLSASQKLALISNHTPTDIIIIAIFKAISFFSYLWKSYRYALDIQNGIHDKLTKNIILLIQVFLILTVLMMALFIIETMTNSFPLKSDVTGALSLGGFIYFSVVLTLSQWASFVNSLSNHSVNQLISAHQTTNDLLEPEDTQTIYTMLCERNKAEKWYLQPNIKLEDVADLMGLPVHYISFVINRESDQNFQNWINHLRLDHFKKAIIINNEQPMLKLALDSGFNSKATFNRVFKKFEGVTPSQYKLEISNKNKAL